MKVKLAKTAGFCFGVNRAVDKVYELVDNGEQHVFTYGPIVHNEAVVSELEKHGVQVIESTEEIQNLAKGTIVIRSHGVGKAVYDFMQSSGLQVADGTCPYVKKIHNIVYKASQAGNKIIIIGDETHPEVQGIIGWCMSTPYLLDTPEEVEQIPFDLNEKLTVVVQTTFNLKKFQDIVEKIQNSWYNSSIVNTICNATQERQAEARQIASSVDAMIVIGGRNSSNTQKLYEICKNECNATYYIQTLEDLAAQNFKTVCTVGITAGASTPKNMIEEVQLNVRTNF